MFAFIFTAVCDALNGFVSLLTLTGRPEGKPDGDLIRTAGPEDGAHQAAPPLFSHLASCLPLHQTQVPIVSDHTT